MQLYDVMLVLASARTGLAALGFARPAGDHRPLAPIAQGLAEICCALLLRTCFDHPYREVLGGWIYPLLAYAVVWSALVWFSFLLPLALDEDEGPVPDSPLGAFGFGLSVSTHRIVAVVWHVAFVAPSLVCGGFVAFGLAGEMGR